MKPTDTSDFMNSLNAGTFAMQVAAALSAVAGGVIEYSKPGEVTLKFKLKQIGQSNQVAISHTLDYVEPTKRGKKREDTTLDTPMYVTANGLELFQTDPTAQMFSREEAPVIAREV